jgi:hypothetical protein
MRIYVCIYWRFGYSFCRRGYLDGLWCLGGFWSLRWSGAHSLLLCASLFGGWRGSLRRSRFYLVDLIPVVIEGDAKDARENLLVKLAAASLLFLLECPTAMQNLLSAGSLLRLWLLLSSLSLLASSELKLLQLALSLSLVLLLAPTTFSLLTRNRGEREPVSLFFALEFAFKLYATLSFFEGCNVFSTLELDVCVLGIEVLGLSGVRVDNEEHVGRCGWV